MATPINAPLTSEIWHLSIEDLLEPLTEMPRLGGPGPFVINLSASSAPLGQPANGLAPPDGAYVYQIQRMEDRRPRYRLRLGPFLTEDEADAVLKRVRDCYPSALTATAEADDLKAIGALKPKSVSMPVSSVPSAPPRAASPAATVSPRPVPTIASVASITPVPGIKPGPTSVPAPTVAFAARPLSARAPAAAARATASIPVLSDCVEPVKRAPPKPSLPITTVAPVQTAIAAPTPIPAKAPVPPKAAVAPKAVTVQAPARTAQPSPPTLVATPRPAAPAPSAAGPAVRPAAPPKPNFEATQTLRPLTAAELQDGIARWYVIQLSLAEESFDPESLPNLDIFSEYRLYSVAGIDQGRIMHALRLGFFTEEGAAAAVASYLGGVYENPTVKRISLAERERFRDQRVEARKDIGATGRHAVIEITGERHIRDKALHSATVTPLTPPAAASHAAPVRRGR